MLRSLRSSRRLALVAALALLPTQLPAQRPDPTGVTRRPPTGDVRGSGYDGPETCRESVVQSAVWGSIAMTVATLGFLFLLKSGSGGDSQAIPVVAISIVAGGAVGALAALPFKPCGPIGNSVPWRRDPGTTVSEPSDTTTVRPPAQSPS